MILAAALALALCAEPPVKLAASKLTGKNVDEQELAYYAEHLAQRLALHGVQVMSASDVSALLGLERQRQLMGCGAAGCATELSQALGADGMVRGSLGRFGDTWQLDLKILSATDGEVLCAYSAKVQGEEALLHELELGSEALVKQLYPKLGRAPPSAVAAPIAWPTLAPPTPGSTDGAADVALVVAIENYAAAPKIPGAKQSGSDWVDYFTDGRGMPASQVLLLRENEATVEGITGALERVVKSARPSGTLWFVFVGHGAPAKNGRDGVLVGWDAQRNLASLDARGLKQQDLLKALGKGKQGRTVVLLDACFSGRAPDGEELVAGLQPALAVPRPASPKALVLSAARADQFAGQLPGAQRPAFSYLVLGGLRGWADKDGDAWVSGQELVDYAAKVLRAKVLDREQTPELWGPAPQTRLARTLGEKAPSLEPAPPVAVAVVAPPTPAPRADPCAPGQAITADTAGHCCWAGQAWAQGRCLGVPTSCPKDFALDVAGQRCVAPTCSEGMVRMSDNLHCCWPEQTWAAGRGACLGVPRCPPGFAAPIGLRDGAERCLKQPTFAADVNLDGQCSAAKGHPVGFGCDLKDYLLKGRADLTMEELDAVRGEYRQEGLRLCHQAAKAKGCWLQSDLGRGAQVVYCCQR